MLIWVCSHFSAPKYARLNIGKGERHIWVRRKVWSVNVRNLEKIQDRCSCFNDLWWVLQSSSQILKHLCDFSLPNVDLGLQSFQCFKIRSAQHWGKRAAHLSENKGVKRECKKFGENSRQMPLFQRFVTSIVGPHYTGQPVQYEHPCDMSLLACVAGIERGRG